MDHIGIPVIASVRPDSATLAVDCGKGITKAHARASAAMEALERYVGDETDVSTFAPRSSQGSRLASLWFAGRSCRRARSTGRSPRSFRPPSAFRFLTTASRFTTGTFLLPRNASRCPRTGLPVAIPETRRSGLFEVIERDAIHVTMSRQAASGKQPPRFNVDSVTHSFAVEAIAKIRAAGCDFRFVYSCDVGLGIPTFIAVIVDREKGTGLFKGYGCHLSPEIALNRSICEAAQARCLIMAGARDDVPGPITGLSWQGRPGRTGTRTSPASRLMSAGMIFRIAQPGRPGRTSRQRSIFSSATRSTRFWCQISRCRMRRRFGW